MSAGAEPPRSQQSTIKKNVKPLLRGHLHQHAIFAALAAGMLLVASASTREARISCTVYVASLVALFSASALYHRVTWNPWAREQMGKVDHAAIFVLIAGTYTPIAQLGFEGELRHMLLVRVWVGAAAGILQSILWPSAPKAVSTAIYIGLGWIILPHAYEVFGYHEVFHAFVVVASILHFAAVYLLVHKT
ncbi:hypothetical protein COCSUDRAFT_83666 [Coccomyxa subellipsoidea C-169]|uniref:Hemolysin III n=1 Tax=Coccomyxa subellipsoidea (strain C-169) TaxID=574566 RepID=I0Z2V4_COCSC|nr:hypothetical protein COCSUDRAFT_83666 [Coccomyxa subellipsoidea C-169]EIE24973.1 hypothetical protein COCSUDRAFT_83666 [Coccomyxa subellipsoidea C-169]|eukprot:XP_005649517.1 hypothetical protein COCSUDRAFT_83666 [Coccomyxa subellipsoidea C-169]